MDPNTARRRRMEQQAEKERGPGDPTAARPAQARRTFAILASAIAVAIALLTIMWVNNTRYDGNSPIPMDEQRQR